MPQTCSICRHPERPKVEEALLAQEPLRSIAKRYGTSDATLFRHKPHISAALAKAVEAEVVTDSGNLLDKIAGLEADARRIGRAAEAAGDRRTALEGVGKLVKIVELLAKVRGELQQEGTVNIVLAPEWGRLRVVLLDALTAYPDAQAAASDAMRRFDARR